MTDESTLKPIGKPPEYFCDARKQIWYEIIDCYTGKPLQANSSIMLELLANLVHQKRTSPEIFNNDRTEVLSNLLNEFEARPRTKIKLLRIWSEKP